MKHVLVPLALLAARAPMPEAEAGDSANGCADGGVYLISVRGSGEARGIGIAGSLLGAQVRDQIKDTKIVALDYAATFTGPPYPLSVGEGIKTLTELVGEHVEACPNDKIAIMGYSQGAQVTLDTICGADEMGFPDTAAIASDKVEKHIVAVALFGDPTYVANMTYNKGTSIRNGIFPRENTDSCLKYADIISSWCDTGDVYCARGNATAVHGQYFNKYGSDIVKFIVDKARGGTAAPTGSVQPSVSTSNGPAAATTTTTATATATTTTSPNAANGLTMASRSLYVALPFALAAVFQML